VRHIKVYITPNQNWCYRKSSPPGSKK